MATWNLDQVMDFKVLRVETYILIFKPSEVLITVFQYNDDGIEYNHLVY